MSVLFMIFGSAILVVLLSAGVFGLIDAVRGWQRHEYAVGEAVILRIKTGHQWPVTVVGKIWDGEETMYSVEFVDKHVLHKCPRRALVKNG